MQRVAAYNKAKIESKKWQTNEKTNRITKCNIVQWHLVDAAAAAAAVAAIYW